MFRTMGRECGARPPEQLEVLSRAVTCYIGQECVE